LAISVTAQETPNDASGGRQVEDVRDAVVSIATTKFHGPAAVSWIATGFCLDPACQFVATNYHVAEIAKPKRLGGEKIVEQHLATSEKDDGATWNPMASLPIRLKFTQSRDLAIFKLRHPLPHHHGANFQVEELSVGNAVDIFAFPKESISPIARRQLLKFHGRFEGETDKGLLAFSYDLADGKAIRPGASGGIVVNSETQRIAGVLSSIATDTRRVALAVPIRSLVDFVNKELPVLAERIFPPSDEIPQGATDLYPKLVPTPHTESLEHRAEEPPAIKLLRSKAQSSAEHMDELIAVQTFTWGAGSRALTEQNAYEVRFLDGEQRFREFPNGKKDMTEVPYPAALSHAVKTTNAWSAALLLIGTEFGLKIQQAADAIVGGRKVKVYQYRGDAEDGVCRFRRDLDLGFLQTHKMYSVDCYGEVWTDAEMNVLRLSQHLELSGKWKNYELVVTYGWLQKTGEPARLVPVTISTQAEHNNKVYWCRGRFMNYQLFNSRVRIVSERADTSQVRAETK
jgi:hypothetical protein